ncbi:MAG: hypothetical protein KIS29_09810 [Thermoplasmata archaeon]|nr:hypothetical protein [Candidatus Sysuiplasma jiujiangense]
MTQTKQENKKEKAPNANIRRIREFIERTGRLAGLSEDQVSMLFLAPTEDIPEIGHRWIEMEEDADLALDVTVSHWIREYIATRKQEPSDEEIIKAYERFDKARVQAMRHDLRQVLFDVMANFKNNVFVSAQDRAEFSTPIQHEQIPLPISFPDDIEYIRMISANRTTERIIIPRQYTMEESE